jgi:hypothetical protein
MTSVFFASLPQSRGNGAASVLASTPIFPLNRHLSRRKNVASGSENRFVQDQVSVIRFGLRFPTLDKRTKLSTDVQLM